MFKALMSMYSFRFPLAVAYMLQSSEYDLRVYLRWLWRTSNFGLVMHRRVLDKTRIARLNVGIIAAGILIQSLLGLAIAWYSIASGEPYVYFGLALLIAAQLLWAHIIVLIVWCGQQLYGKRQEKQTVRAAQEIFSQFKGVKIAVAGSYGKTTLKELLYGILSEGMKVASTPANKNVLISHARFARQLQGDEQVLIIEYGEGRPGDVERFANYTQPTHAVITGIAPAHLDQYKTLSAAAKDIFSVTSHVPSSAVYVNGESSDAVRYSSRKFARYTRSGTLDWQVSDVEVAIDGMKFVMKKGKKTLHLTTSLVGKHLIGPLALCVQLAHELGLSDEQIARGVSETAPYEHRMQPYSLNGGWVIDDSYNGNLEGIRAGTQLLQTLSAKRKVYVTPGLVDQGNEVERVHIEVGQYIAQAKPDLVVLMQNSTTVYIQKGLKDGGYEGEIRLEDNPLDFYTNLSHFVAKGDLVMLQNDWTDNYA